MRAERFLRPLNELPRVMPCPPTVSAIGYLPAKSNWVQGEFDRIVFCFILKGEGGLYYGNRKYAVQSPCVLAGWPGVYMEYGPTPEGASWEELYLDYSFDLTPLFETWGISPAQHPAWPIASGHTVRRLANELIGYAQHVTERGIADRMDRICHRLLLESVLAQPAMPETPYDAKLDHLRGRLAAHLDLAYNTAALADECGMSEVTFRRYWKRRFGLPFKHDLITMRMQEACRLLVHTRSEIKEIAAQVGFTDPHYFSHRFTTLIGTPASEYRNRFSAMP
jgi:AraC-like DNA-binding protein